MDLSSKSYWTKRRYVRAKVAEHIAYINDKKKSAQIGHSIGELSDSSSSLFASSESDIGGENLMHSENDLSSSCNVGNQHHPKCTDTGDSCQDGDYSYVSNVKSLLEECDGDVYFEAEDALSDDSLPDENYDSSEKEYKLMHNLKMWANQFNIPHTAVSSLLDILRDDYPNLPKDPRTLLGTVKQYDIKEVSGGEYFHFGIASTVGALLSSSPSSLTGIDIIKFQVNIDGLPLFKSTNMQLWPILGKLVTPFNKSPFIIGIYCGNEKPGNVGEYLNEFINEMSSLERVGITIGGNKYTIKIACFVCDAPARAFIKQIKGHSGYHGCDSCTQRGKWVNKMTFPQTDSPLRTDVEFDQMADEDHHLQLSPLSRLNLGMISQFPLDYMHLVCLGVVKRILWLWMKGPVSIGCRMGSKTICQISDSLLMLHKQMPNEFLRKGRSLAEIERWKASEFRQFLLYTGPISLLGKLSDHIYKNFMLLFVGIYCLSSEHLYQSYCDYAKDILCYFVKEFGEIYGKDMLVYNVHGLVHLADNVRQYGPLDRFSAFPFESYLGNIKKLVRKPNFPLQQIIRRISEKKGTFFNIINESPTFQLKGKQARCSLVTGFEKYCCFREIRFPNFMLSVNDGDNCIQIDRTVAIVRNILSPSDHGESSEVIIIYEKFKNIGNFFSYPLNSSDLHIYECCELSGDYNYTPVSLIACKCILLPCRQKYIAIPLVHSHVPIA